MTANDIPLSKMGNMCLILSVTISHWFLPLPSCPLSRLKSIKATQFVWDRKKEKEMCISGLANTNSARHVFLHLDDVSNTGTRKGYHSIFNRVHYSTMQVEEVKRKRDGQEGSHLNRKYSFRNKSLWTFSSKWEFLVLPPIILCCVSLSSYDLPFSFRWVQCSIQQSWSAIFLIVHERDIDTTMLTSSSRVTRDITPNFTKTRNSHDGLDCL